MDRPLGLHPEISLGNPPVLKEISMESLRWFQDYFLKELLKKFLHEFSDKFLKIMTGEFLKQKFEEICWINFRNFQIHCRRESFSRRNFSEYFGKFLKISSRISLRIFFWITSRNSSGNSFRTSWSSPGLNISMKKI